MRLLAHESAGDGSAAAPAVAAERVFAALFRGFAPVIGTGGFLALVARSVKLAKVEFPGLGGTVAGGPPESETQLVKELVGRLSQLEPRAASAAATGLLGSLFALMTTFIGEQLVWQIMKNAFPAIGEKEETE